MTKTWQIQPSLPQELQNKFREINPIILQLLYNRGITTQEEIDEFLNPDYGEDLHDPFLFSDMQKVVARIFQALEKQEKIVIHGDYDADGVCGSIILRDTLKELVGQNIEVYLPHREKEGYGLNINTAKYLKESGTNLVITVDCGTTNVEEITYLQSNSIDVIVIDHHHSPEERPPFFGFINPKFKDSGYPFDGLASGGVAFKVAQALISQISNVKSQKLQEGWEKWLLDLVAIATITDMSPLIGENRTLVKYGLTVLNKTRRLGLKKLLQVASISKIGPYEISFMIGPRINAAGRMDHANAAYKLLVSENEEEATRLAKELNSANQERQLLTDQITEAAIKSIEGQLEKNKILIAAQKKEDNIWPVGIIGLVASKIVQKFNRPAIVIGRGEMGLSGSGRSVKAFNLIEALETMPELFTKFGGHAQACGFSLKSEDIIEDLTKRLNDLANQSLKEEDLLPALKIDKEINFSDFSFDLVNQIENIGPFGMANPKPVFTTLGTEVVSIEKVGRDGQHLKMRFLKDGVEKKAIGFSMNNSHGSLQIGEKIDIAYELLKSEWNGFVDIELKIIDLRIQN